MMNVLASGGFPDSGTAAAVSDDTGDHATAAPRAQALPDPAALEELGRALRAAGYRFTTVTPATHSRVKNRSDHVWARNVADIFGWSRPFRADALPADLLALMVRAGIAQPHRDGWRSTLRASTLDGELYFHSAYPTSEADAVFFGPDTYRFGRALRSELAVIAAAGRPVRRAADVGAGAGPGALTIARHCPDAEVLALDINDRAMHLCRVNAQLAGLANVATRHSNLLSDVPGEFDLIVSNPPYLLDKSERAYRHGGGELGAGLSLALTKQALTRLAPGGSLLLYTGVVMINNDDPFLRRIEPLLAQAAMDWHYEEIDPDVFGEELDTPAYAEADRIAAVWLKASRPLH
ncbi:methyltransferase [Pseudoduganella umbonata]|uniref:Methylase of polypeptide subunit release factors n=2 Tax=Pseudoduganella umbonata TaxID=864828 RepID=A0A7W5E7V6_9BURK|nr:class I SAM-dependent methyltransferase [Pseudoduganella umbonata]MBB3220143.1 methylase of polypeptide subunit release factors [Pseudoduganella umbonata]